MAVPVGINVASAVCMRLTSAMLPVTLRLRALPHAKAAMMSTILMLQQSAPTSSHFRL